MQDAPIIRFALRVKQNDRKLNAEWMAALQQRPSGSADWRSHHTFMRQFSPGRFLGRVPISWEDNHGPSSGWMWETSALPGQMFDSKQEALEYWKSNSPVIDVVPEVVQITMQVV